MTLYTQLPLVEDVKFPWLFNDSMQIFKSVKKELSNISYDCQFAMSKIGEIHACINVISLWNSVGTPNRNPANYTEIIFLHLKFPWPVANFPDFFHNSKFPWLFSKFTDFSLTLNFPDFPLTSGNVSLKFIPKKPNNAVTSQHLTVLIVMVHNQNNECSQILWCHNIVWRLFWDKRA